MPESARQASLSPRTPGGVLGWELGVRALEVDDCFAPCVGNTQQDQDDDDARHDRQREERAVVVRAEVEKGRGDERAHDRPGVIHAAMETENLPAVGFGGERRQHRVARRRADALAQPVGEPQREDLQPSAAMATNGRTIDESP